MPVDIGNGVLADTVGDLLGAPTDFIEVETALAMPKLATTPTDPPLGIHFGMPEEKYHRIGAFSNSGLARLLASPTSFWADSWLNPDREETDRAHLTLGKAYHAMILEGHDAYTARFYPMPDPRDYPKALRLADEIKQAIIDRDHKPWTRIDVPGQEGKTKAATKSDHIAQLAMIDRSVEVWDLIVQRAEQRAAGRQLISVDDDRRIRIAARMIAQDPTLAKAFTGGHSEVTLIWRDPHQGILCKARTDYLKLRAVVDLKTFANKRNRSVRRAIINAIAEERYCLQPAVYLQGVDQVRKLVRQHGDAAIHVWPHKQGDELTIEDQARVASLDEWATKWASNTAGDRWLWCFQQKGDAPVTRGLWHPLAGTTHSIAQSMFLEGVRRFRECTEIFGVDPWLDLAPVDDIDDSEIPAWGLEI